MSKFQYKPVGPTPEDELTATQDIDIAKLKHKRDWRMVDIGPGIIPGDSERTEKRKYPFYDQKWPDNLVALVGSLEFESLLIGRETQVAADHAQKIRKYVGGKFIACGGDEAKKGESRWPDSQGTSDINHAQYPGAGQIKNAASGGADCEEKNYPQETDGPPTKYGR